MRISVGAGESDCVLSEGQAGEVGELGQVGDAAQVGQAELAQHIEVKAGQLIEQVFEAGDGAGRGRLGQLGRAGQVGAHTSRQQRKRDERDGEKTIEFHCRTLPLVLNHNIIVAAVTRCWQAHIQSQMYKGRRHSIEPEPENDSLRGCVDPLWRKLSAGIDRQTENA